MGLVCQTKVRAEFCDLYSSLLHYFILQVAKRTSNLYLETSAVTGHNVKRAFYKLAETLIHSYGIFQPGQEVSLLLQSTVYRRSGNFPFCMTNFRVEKSS